MNWRNLIKSKSGGVDAIGIAVAALLTVIFAFGLIAPLALRGRMAAAHAAMVQQQKQRLASLTAQVKAATAAQETARVRLAASPLHLRPLAAMNRRLADVVSLAGACGVTVIDLHPGDAVRGKRCTTVPVRLTGRGDFASTVALMRRLQDELSDLHVASFKLTGNPEDPAAVPGCVLELRWRCAADLVGPAVASVGTP